MAHLPPSTADVIEFRCQYTYNVTQKRKKWNDGCLKFHTFNKLIRVFDEDNSHVGQKHWQGGDALQDGNEFQLDNMLICVQDVLRCTQTNIAPLFEKRKKQPLALGSGSPHGETSAERLSQKTYISQAGASRADGVMRSTAGRQSQHKSLSALLGTRRGPVGKAVAPVSPFEVRNGLGPDDGWADGSPCKKRKTDSRDDPPWTVTTTTKPRKAMSICARQDAGAASAKKPTVRKLAQGKATASQKTLRVKSVIDLTANSSPVHGADVEVQLNGIITGECVAAQTEFARPIHRPSQTGRVPDTASCDAARMRIDQNCGANDIENFVPDAGNLEIDKQARVTRDKPRKHLVLSKSKKRSTLMCLSAEPANASCLSMDTDRSEQDTGREESVRLSRHADREVHERVVELTSMRSRPLACPSKGRDSMTSKHTETREPLRDVLQRANLRQRRGQMPPPAAPASASPIKKSFGRSQSDPTSMGSEMGITSSAGARACANEVAKPTKRMLRRTQTVMPRTEEFRIPDSIFTQLPPETDKALQDLGPWSREAFDLFDWRPPDWEQRLASRPSAVGMVD